jgi:hypothetical protein
MATVRTGNVNSHVDRLHRFLPFSSVHDQIYEEYQTGEDSLNLETVAIRYAIDAVTSGAKLVILTGDAGHGKTHMCRRLLESELLGYSSEDARRLLLTSCDGSMPISSVGSDSNLALRIHKDLSEIQPPSRAAAFLEQSSLNSHETLIVCANEGRLRAIVGSEGAGQVCRSIGALFQSSIQTGVTIDSNGSIHIVNLNYQSVAAREGNHNGSLLRRVLMSWVGDGRRWGDRSCGSCLHEPTCPIRRNRALLAEEGATSELRLGRLEEMFEVVERLGHVITIREMLMLIAYLITGGMTCRDVDKRSAGAPGRLGWQHAWAYYNLLFCAPPNLPAERVDKGIPILSAFRRIDPGAIAIRLTDEKILNRGDLFDPNQSDLQFLVNTGGRSIIVDAALGIDDFNGNPQSRADLNREVDATNLVVAALRRRTFFDDQEGRGTVMARLGFRHGDTFQMLLSGDLPTPEKVRIKGTIIAGLHAIQGLKIGRTETTLYLVDPAFGKASADAAIIARQIPSSKIKIQSASEAWLAEAAPIWFLPRSVDWIDRAVVLGVDEGRAQLSHLHLDLLSFECVSRAASGYVSEEFYANEIRRVRTFLGQLAESGRSESAQISVFMEGRLQNISLDMDVIQVGGQ